VGGNPPADVTWYKDGVQTGGTKKENNTLTLKNVDETASGIYTCLARSYPDPEYEDNETIVVRVNCKYYIILYILLYFITYTLINHYSVKKIIPWEPSLYRVIHS
jgi:hypothetical protein